MEASPLERPFFIVSAARSGTTLLRVMLDRHPEVAIPPESHFIPLLFRRRARYGDADRVERPDELLGDLAADVRFRTWDLPIERVRDELEALGPAPAFSEAVRTPYRAYARLAGKPRWGDKTPRYVEQIPLLDRLFPDGRFVNMVRDGRDVALSMIDLGRLHRRAATPALEWRAQIRRGRAGGRLVGPERFMEVRYEELLDQPEAVLRRLAGFLDLGFDPVMLHHDERALERVPEGQRRMHTRIAMPPTKGLRDWRTQMPPGDVAEFEAVAGRELVESGYARAGTGSVAAALRAWARIAWFQVRTARRRLRVKLRTRKKRRDAARASDFPD
ncbi:MAG: sulfotransferase [Actinobacteria bacterium]|nr:sulfotransferase [Actinomycetota bacterium]